MHYNSIAVRLRKIFGERVVKLAIDARLTCPNRDGTKGVGGCAFCSDEGSGEFASDIEDQIAGLSRKWESAKYIAYFQSHTNTYAPVETLRKLWTEAISHEGVVGLAIATRPDCLPEDVLDLLSEFNEKTFLWVELGLQTRWDETAERMNRCYETAEFAGDMKALSERGIRSVVHLILGLPGETREMMIESAEYAASLKPFGLKLHMLNVLKGTALADMEPELMSEDEYVKLAVDILERIPPEITIHRLTGDPPGEKLIAPEWVRNKHRVLNRIQQEFSARGSRQGIRWRNDNG